MFLTLAFVSRHPNPGPAVIKAMGLALVVGIPLLGLISDAVTGVVAGYGAGGAAALRPEPGRPWAHRAIAVILASLLSLFLVRTTTPLGLLLSPALPLTGLGIADALGDRAAREP